MSLKLSNNATSLLAGSINTGSLTVVITSGDEGNFPTLGGGDWCPITVVDGAGNLEIMRCTARAGVTLTVVRAQEGTTAKNFSAGARVDSRLTAAALLALDLSSFTGKLPISVGGTNAATAMEALDNLSTVSAPIASATTTDLSAATGVIVPVTGNAVITGFGVEQAGARREVRFSGTPTLTHNATSLILLTAANIVVQAGDTGFLESLGAGNWQMMAYTRASGRPLLPVMPTTTVDNALLKTLGTAGNMEASGILVDDNNAVSGVTKETISSALAGALLLLESTEAGASSGPDIEGYRKSATPAALDALMRVLWYANNVALTKTLVADIHAILTDPTTGSEDAVIEFNTILAGAYVRRLSLAAGLFMEGAAGGDKGVGTINATALFANGTQIPFSKSFDSGQQTIVRAALLTLPHGLGVSPPLYAIFAQCTGADGGYAVGEETLLSTFSSTDPGAAKGVSVRANATTLLIRFASDFGPIRHIRADTGDEFDFDLTKWRFVARAWA